jgi:hypothetical protein
MTKKEILERDLNRYYSEYEVAVLLDSDRLKKSTLDKIEFVERELKSIV